MLKFFYDIAVIILGLAWSPKLFQEKYKTSIKRRLGFVLPEIATKEPLIWIHSVSMGETKAAAALIQEFRRTHSDQRFVVSTVTETGQEEAKRIIPGAEAYFFLPLDLSWVVRKFIKKVQPKTLILVEGEFWYNLIDEAKKSGAKVILVNGKLSERSAKRFNLVPWFSRPLFSQFDLLCLQTREYRDSFLTLGVDPKKLHVTGNLKFDINVKDLSLQEREDLQKSFGIKKEDFVVVLGSTHEGEETALLDAIKPLFDQIPHLKIFLVPRHPQRFDRAAEILREKNLSFDRYSSGTFTGAPVVLIDTMGKLMACFQIAQIGIVAGSFIPGIGAHNLFEPAACALPVLFGPYFDAQKAYAEVLISSQGGLSRSAEKIGQEILSLYKDPNKLSQMGVAALEIVQQSLGAAKKTVKALEANSFA